MNLSHGGNISFYCEKYNLRPQDIIDFSANINPLGFPKSVKAIINKNISSLVHYPDPDCKNLIKELANNLNTAPENIFVGNGSIEIIYLISKVINPKNTLICLPTFSEYEISAKQVNSKIIYIKANKKENFRIDIDKIIKHIPKVDLIFVCNPNNPTGYLIPENDIYKLIKKCEEQQTYLVIDEGFINLVDNEKEFINISEASLRNYLIIIKSFTKLFALPGIRLGYCITNRRLIKKLNEARYPWSVNSLAQAVGEKIVKSKDFITKSIKLIKKEKIFLLNELKKIEFVTPYPSYTNFILCELRNTKLTSTVLTDMLGKKGILIRDCVNFKGLNNKFFRIAVRTRKENIKLINNLKEINYV